MTPSAGAATDDLPDVNVWLALSVPEHVHHSAALAWWQQGAGAKCCFNRVTAYFSPSRTPISADAGQRFRRSRTAFQADPGQGFSVIADSGGARE